MLRNRALIRVLEELKALEAARNGLTLRELAGEFQVTDRTIRRDLEALQAAGVPVVDDVDAETRARRYRVMDWRSEAA